MLNKTFTSALAGSALVLGLAFAGSNAIAAPTYCSDAAPLTSNLDGLNVTNMTWLGVNSADCYGVVDSGNPGEGTLTLSKWGDPFNFLVKDDKAGINNNKGTIGGVEFTLDAGIGAKTGNWGLSWKTDGSPGLPITLDFVGVLGGGNKYAAYLFNNTTFTTSPDFGVGTFTIALKAGNSQNLADLSNLTLFARVVDTPSVPEPATLGMLGLGLLGMAAIRRRKLGLKS